MGAGHGWAGSGSAPLNNLKSVLSQTCTWPLVLVLVEHTAWAGPGFDQAVTLPRIAHPSQPVTRPLHRITRLLSHIRAWPQHHGRHPAVCQLTGHRHCAQL